MLLEQKGMRLEELIISLEVEQEDKEILVFLSFIYLLKMI